MTAAGTRPKKILHVITTAGVGGAELMLCRLLERNDPDRHQQAVLSLLTPHSLKERFEASAPLHTLDMRPPLPGPNVLRKLRRIIRDYRPDLIQGWMYHGNLAAVVGAGLAGYLAVALGQLAWRSFDAGSTSPTVSATAWAALAATFAATSGPKRSSVWSRPRLVFWRPRYSSRLPKNPAWSRGASRLWAACSVKSR